MRELLISLRTWLLKWIIIPAGIFFVSASLFALTTGPFYLYHYFGTANSDYDFEPQYIVQLGSTPMPSEQALIRCYYTRKLAQLNPDARVIISQLREAGQQMDQTDAWKMKEEISRDFSSAFTYGLLTDAHSTREEALLLRKKFAGIRGRKVVLVTSPEHMLRAIATFRRAGFQQVGGEAAFSWAGNADFRYREHRQGGRMVAPEMGNNLQLRYQFWNHLRYELLCTREFLAFFWYRLKGWA